LDMYDISVKIHSGFAGSKVMLFHEGMTFCPWYHNN